MKLILLIFCAVANFCPPLADYNTRTVKVSALSGTLFETSLNLSGNWPIVKGKLDNELRERCSQIDQSNGTTYTHNEKVITNKYFESLLPTLEPGTPLLLTLIAEPSHLMQHTGGMYNYQMSFDDESFDGEVTIKARIKENPDNPKEMRFSELSILNCSSIQVLEGDRVILYLENQIFDKGIPAAEIFMIIRRMLKRRKEKDLPRELPRGFCMSDDKKSISYYTRGPARRCIEANRIAKSEDPRLLILFAATISEQR